MHCSYIYLIVYNDYVCYFTHIRICAQKAPILVFALRLSFYICWPRLLTALIVFIAAVNGAVDNKLTLNKSKEEEPLFNYNYGFSFFCSVFSFLMQEFNGICNIYWYIDYYRKYRLNKTSQGDSKLTRIGRIPIIKVNYVDFNEPSAKTKTSELSPSLSNNNNNNRSLNFEINEIKKLNSADEKESGNETENKLFILRKPSINKQHKLKHKIYKSNFRKDNPKIGFNFDQSDQEYEDDSSKLSETVENTNENSSESNLIRSIEHLKSAPTPTKSNDTPPPLPLALPVPSNKFATQSNKAQTGLKRPEESSLPTSTSSSATSTPIKSSISSMSNTSEISSLCPPLMNSDKFKKDVLIKGGRAFVTNNNNNKKNRKKEQTVLTVNEKSSKMDLDENDLKIKFYKLDQEYRLQNENNYSVLKKHPSVQYYQNKYTYQHKSPPRQQQQQQQGQKSSQKPSPLNLNLTNAKMTQKQRQDSFKKSPKFIYFSQDQEHANQIEAEKQRPIISNSNSSSKIFQYPSFLNTEFSSLADTSNHAYFNNKLNSKSSNIYSAYTNDEDLAEELIRPLTVAMANAASAAALAAASYITNRTNQFSGNQAAPSRSTNKFQRIKSNRPQMKRNKSLTDYYKLSKMPNTNANHNYQPVTKYILHDDYTNEFQLRNRSTNLLNNLNARLLACSNMSANAQLIFSKPNLKRTTSV